MHLNIKTDAPADTMEELTDAFGPAIAQRLWNDFVNGRRLRLKEIINEEFKVSRQNATASHRGADGMGQVEVRMSQRLKYAIIGEYGREAYEDPDFVRKLGEDSGFRFKPAWQRKAQITHPGLKGLRKWHALHEAAPA